MFKNYFNIHKNKNNFYGKIMGCITFMSNNVERFFLTIDKSVIIMMILERRNKNKINTEMDTNRNNIGKRNY